MQLAMLIKIKKKNPSCINLLFNDIAAYCPIVLVIAASCCCQ